MQYSKFFDGLIEQAQFDEQQLNKLIETSEISPITNAEQKAKILEITTGLFKSSKLSSPDEVADVIKKITTGALEYIKSLDFDTNLSFSIASIYLSISKLFNKEFKNLLSNNATTFLVNLLYKNGKHFESMDVLIDTFQKLSNSSSDENKRMYYISRSNEIIRYKTSVENGTDNKLSPTSSEKLAKAFEYKEMGAEAFKKSDFKKAILYYHSANNYVSGLMGLDGEEDVISKSLCLVLLNNIAVCSMKLGKNGRAIELLDQVLKLDEKNVKALFRRGKCLMAENQYNYAQEDLEKALSLAPDDKEIQNELKILKSKSAEFKKAEAKVYSKIFD